MCVRLDAARTRSGWSKYSYPHLPHIFATRLPSAQSLKTGAVWLVAALLVPTRVLLLVLGTLLFTSRIRNTQWKEAFRVARGGVSVAPPAPVQQGAGQTGGAGDGDSAAMDEDE